MNPIMILVVLFVLLLLGVPIGVSLGMTNIFVAAGGLLPAINLRYIVRGMVSTMDSFPLLAIPLFVLGGEIMARGGISKRLFNLFTLAFGKITGGLPIASVATCLFYGAISGSGPATVAAVGSMALPVLDRLGYEHKFSVSLLGVAGGLGVIIPPSIPFIIYGQAADQSVADLFIAGIIPGLLIGAFLMLYCYYYCRNTSEDREKVNAEIFQLRQRGLLSVFLDSIWALLTPVIILGGIYSGYFTPTEAAAVSTVYAFIVSLFVYKEMSVKDIYPTFKAAVHTIAPVLIILASASVFARILTMLQIPQNLSSGVLSIFSNEIIILLIINAILLVAGMFIDTISAILILAPLFLPLATLIGVDPIHLGVIMVVSLAIGFVTPPVGANLYVASAIGNVPIQDIFVKVIPMLVVFLIALLIITFVPSLSLLLI